MTLSADSWNNESDRGEAILEDLGGYETCGRYYVRCSKCDIAQDNLWATKHTAIKRWNKRVSKEE